MTDKHTTGYSRTVFFESELFEVVSIEWKKDSVSFAHNHGWSQCSVLIQEGVFKNTMNIGGKQEIQLLEKGQLLNIPIGASHQFECVAESGKTLHVYSPKIKEHTDEGRFSFVIDKDFKEQIKLTEPTKLGDLQKILHEIKDHSITAHSPYFMNQLFSGVSPQMLLAEDLINQTKTTLATNEASPAFSAIEAEVIEKLGELIGWNENSRDGVVVPGGSFANFMAVHCARQKYDAKIKTDGQSGQNFKIFVSSEAHYSFKKAAMVLGLGTQSVVPVPCDQEGCMQELALADLIQLSIARNEIPLMVCATAGTTVLGAFDRIHKISSICKKNNIWLHVDGAWGGPALFSKKLRKFVEGIETADSVTFDAHKLFGAAMTCSIFATQHRGLLHEANDVSGADYLFHNHDETTDRGKQSWQCGRGADVVSFWTIWKSFGTEGLGHFVDQLLAVRDEAIAWIKTQSRLELIADPQYLNICVRVKPSVTQTEGDEKNWAKHIREKLKNNQQALVNYSVNDKGTFLRLILANPQTKFEHVRNILNWSLEVE